MIYVSAYAILSYIFVKGVADMHGIDLLMRWLMDDDAVGAIRNNFDDLLALIPELAPCVGFDHRHPHHHLDVWEHTLSVISHTDASRELRLAALFHDIGKPQACVEGEVRHFYGHPKLSAEICREVLGRLGVDLRAAERVEWLVRWHDTAFDSITDMRDELLPLLYSLQSADTYAHDPDKIAKRVDYLNRFNAALNGV